MCVCVDALACICMFVYASLYACVTKKVQQREAYNLNSSSDAACKGDGKKRRKETLFPKICRQPIILCQKRF